MPRPRFDKLPVERRAQILEIAADELAERGFEGASLNRILERAQISKGAAYYYFDDKNDLFTAVAQTHLARLASELPLPAPATLDAATFLPAVEALFRKQFRDLATQPRSRALAKAIWSLPREVLLQDPLAEPVTRVLSWVTSMLAHGKALGLVRTDLPDDLLLALVMAVDDAHDRWLAKHLDPLDTAALEAAADRVVDAIRRLLAPA